MEIKQIRKQPQKEFIQGQPNEANQRKNTEFNFLVFDISCIKNPVYTEKVVYY